MFRKLNTCLSLLGASALAFSLAACGGKAESSGRQDPDQPAAGTIELWDYEGQGVSDEAMKAAITAFEKANPEVKIKRTSFAFADLSKSIVQGGVGGEVPDVAIIDNVDNQNFAALNLLKDITKEVGGDKDQYFPGPWQSTQLDGKTYGLPMNSNNLGLFYNQKMFAQAGIKQPPTTWAELQEVAQKLASGDQAGLAISGIKNEQGTFQVLPFVWQTGGDLNNYDKSGAEALGFLKQMIDSKAMSSAVTNYSQEDARTQFTSGKAAMMVNGPWEISNLKDVDFEWSVAPLPKGKQAATGLGGENVVVFENAKNSAAALKFAKFMASKEGAKTFCDVSGQLSSRPDLAGKLKLSDDPKWKVFEEQLKDAHARAYGKEYAQISELVQASIQEALTGAKTPEAAAQDAFKKIKPLLPEQK